MEGDRPDGARYGLEMQPVEAASRLGTRSPRRYHRRFDTQPRRSNTCVRPRPREAACLSLASPDVPTAGRRPMSRVTSWLKPATTVYAHCDVPCGIYDPHGAELAANGLHEFSPVTLAYASQKYADSCLAGRAAGNNQDTCDEPVTMHGSEIHDWINEWAYSSLTLNHTSIMKTLANTARNGTPATWCDVCRLFAAHTSAHAKLPQDLGLTAQVPIAQFVDVCQSSPIKDWIGAPPDPDLTRILNTGPYQCEVCIPGSTPGPDRCTCAAHQIPATPYDGLNCLQCGANEIAVPLGPNWYCYGCGLGVAIDGQNACQCNLGAIPEADGSRCQCGPNSTQAADGTCPCITGATRGSDGICVGGCGQHEIWQGGQCVDCVDASWPNSTKTACLTCPPSAPLCIPPMFLLQCYSNCVVDCGDLNAPPEPGSMLCGPRCSGPGPCPF